MIASPSRPDDAAAMFRTCVAAAKVDGSVCVFLEPIALYHTRDLYEDGDGLWLAPPSAEHVPLGSARTYGDGRDLTIVTWGNGLRCRSAPPAGCDERGIESRVVDLRWLAPLPSRTSRARRSRRSGSWSSTRPAAPAASRRESSALLLDAGFDGRLARAASKDSFVPLGDAARLVLLSEDEIEAAALELV